MRTSSAPSFYFGGLLAFAVLFYFWQVDPVPLSAYLLAMLVWALASLPLALWYGGQKTGLPMFEIVALAFGTAYSLPAFLVHHVIIIQSQERSLPWELINQTLGSASLGMAALLVGFYSFKQTGRLLTGRLDLPMLPKRRIEYAYLAMAIGVGARVVLDHFGGAGGFNAIAALFAGQFNLGLILLGYGIISDPRSATIHKIVLYGCVCVGVIQGLLTGMLSAAFLPVIVILILRWHLTGRFPLGIIALAVGALLLLNPAKYEYRQRIWYGQGTDALGPLGRLEVWAEAVGHHLIPGRENLYMIPGTQSDAVSQTMGRIDLLNKFAYVRSMTPGEVPFFEGKTYSYLMYALIPRILWPNKPTVTETQDLMDFSYNFRSPNDPFQSTKIGMGMIAEAYANFGEYGVFFVMFFIGATFAFLDKLLNGPQSVGGKAIFLGIMAVFVNGIGTQVIVLFGSIFQIVAANAIIMRPFATGFMAYEPVPTPGFVERPRRSRRRPSSAPLPPPDDSVQG